MVEPVVRVSARADGGVEDPATGAAAAAAAPGAYLRWRGEFEPPFRFTIDQGMSTRPEDIDRVAGAAEREVGQGGVWPEAAREDAEVGAVRAEGARPEAAPETVGEVGLDDLGQGDLGLVRHAFLHLSRRA
jgi:hypothetical protein